MSATIYAVGSQGRITSLKPADTAEAVLYEAGAHDLPVAVQLIISNNSGGAVNATVRWSDGVTDYDIYATKSIAANDTLVQDFYLPLGRNGSVKVTSSSGGALTFSLVTITTGGANIGRGAR